MKNIYWSVSIYRLYQKLNKEKFWESSHHQRESPEIWTRGLASGGSAYDFPSHMINATHVYIVKKTNVLINLWIWVSSATTNSFTYYLCILYGSISSNQYNHKVNGITLRWIIDMLLGWIGVPARLAGSRAVVSIFFFVSFNDFP